MIKWANGGSIVNISRIDGEGAAFPALIGRCKSKAALLKHGNKDVCTGTRAAQHPCELHEPRTDMLQEPGIMDEVYHRVKSLTPLGRLTENLVLFLLSDKSC